MIAERSPRQALLTNDASGVRPDWSDKLRDMLLAIDTANAVREVGLFPGWRLHPLKGNYQGFYGLTLTGNWRLIFRFEYGEAFDLAIVDYH